MKKIILFLIAAVTIVGFNAIAQPGYITTVAGNGTAGYTGDGGPATLAELNSPFGVAVDKTGNVYIAEYYNNCIRKVSNTGIISTIAGNGTAGYSGDGGLATAAQLSSPRSVALDNYGNIYFLDYNNGRVRKIDTAGIITTFAGNGSSSYSGDGGQATAAGVLAFGLAFDNFGNCFIQDGNHCRIRKINNIGIITTIAGNGISGFSGDGGPATLAQMSNCAGGIAIDNIGNIYFSDGYNDRIRKIDNFGIINTIAGCGAGGFYGDGGPATLATLWFPRGVNVDDSGNIYISDTWNLRIRKVNATSGVINTIAGTGVVGYSGDGGPATLAAIDSSLGIVLDVFGDIYVAATWNNRIRKINGTPTIISDSFSVFAVNNCSGINLKIRTNSFSSGQHIKTYFGDGKSLDTSVSFYGPKGIARFSESYTSSGTYTIKHVLYDGIFAVDSITYSKTVSLCQNIALSLYYDVLGTCTYDNTIDKLVLFPSLLEVDSNSVSVDTLSVTGGLYYRAFGNMGDIYTFKVISSSDGMVATCPSSGIISQTISTQNNVIKYLGFNCSSTTSFDLKGEIYSSAGPHQQRLNIWVSNTYCTPKNAVVTIKFSPKYNFHSAIPIH